MGANFQRINSPTLHGGAYSIVYFLDAEEQPCAKEEASLVEIKEFDAQGNEIFRVHAEIKEDDTAR